MGYNKGKDNAAYRHGMARKGKRPAVYLRWRSMLARCYSKTNKDYPRYGGAGVTVCDRWRFGDGVLSGFECWLADMGMPPFKGATLDRKDGRKGYTPDNCRWVTAQERANNRRSNRMLEAFGETHSVAQWARIVGIGPKTIRYRLEQGVPPEQALSRVPNRGTRLS